MLLQRLIGLARCKSIEKYTNCRETRGEDGSARRNALPLLPITFKLEYNSNKENEKWKIARRLRNALRAAEKKIFAVGKIRGQISSRE